MNMRTSFENTEVVAFDIDALLGLTKAPSDEDLKAARETGFTKLGVHRMTVEAEDIHSDNEVFFGWYMKKDRLCRNVYRSGCGNRPDIERYRQLDDGFYYGEGGHGPTVVFVR